MIKTVRDLPPEIRNDARRVAKLAYVRDYMGLMSDDTGYPVTLDYDRQNEALFRAIYQKYGECRCPQQDCPSYEAHAMVQDLIERMEHLGRNADEYDVAITINGVEQDLDECVMLATSY